MTPGLVWLGVALVHFGCTLMLVIYVFGAGMARFDDGTPASMTERIANIVVGVLASPIVNGLADLVPRSLQPRGFPCDHLLFMLNSALWATAVTTLWKWRKLRRKEP